MLICIRLISRATITASFGAFAFPTGTTCEEIAGLAAAGVFSDAECPFLKSDFLDQCCEPQEPSGIVCSICESGQALANP
jgi:hypothetical protein